MDRIIGALRKTRALVIIVAHWRRNYKEYLAIVKAKKFNEASISGMFIIEILGYNYKEYLGVPVITTKFTSSDSLIIMVTRLVQAPKT
jgi:hypothetical protein